MSDFMTDHILQWKILDLKAGVRDQSAKKHTLVSFRFERDLARKRHQQCFGPR